MAGSASATFDGQSAANRPRAATEGGPASAGRLNGAYGAGDSDGSAQTAADVTKEDNDPNVKATPNIGLIEGEAVEVDAGDYTSTPLATVCENGGSGGTHAPPVPVKSPRHFLGGLRPSASSPGLSTLMRAHSRGSSSALPSIKIDPNVGAPDPAVDIEYTLLGGRALQRTASLTTVHHFGDDSRRRSGPRTARTDSSAGSSRRQRFGPEISGGGDIVSPSLTSHSDGFTVSTLQGNLLTPGDSPEASGWPTGWRSPAENGDRANKHVLPGRHQDDHSAFTVVVNRDSSLLRQAYAPSSPSGAEHSLTHKLQVSAIDLTTPRNKAHRPPVINTQIARLEYTSISKTAAVLTPARTPLLASKAPVSPAATAWPNQPNLDCKLGVPMAAESVSSEAASIKTTSAKSLTSAGDIERLILDDLATPS